MEFILAFLLAFLILGYLTLKRKAKKSHDRLVLTLLEQAEIKSKLLIDEAKANAAKLTLELENSRVKQKIEHEKEENALKAREERLERERTKLQQKMHELEKKEKALQVEAQGIKETLYHAKEDLYMKAKLTAGEAHSLVLKEAEKELLSLTLKRRQEAEERAHKEAHHLIVSSLSRVSANAIQEASTTHIRLPNEEMKAKIIGREGKNIKALQQLTGVTIVIDDTPEMLVLSCFDASRREIAKLALDELIQDGRITPARIEEAIESAKVRLPDLLLQYGQEAADRVHVTRLHPEILRTLGALKLRTSLGQNQLFHSIEVAEIMQLLASELGLDSQRARRMGLLHDIGKALKLEDGPTHALAGYRFCLEWHETEEVANGVGSHHGEMPALNKEAEILKCADYLSGARRGVRSENSLSFFQRLKELEEEALKFEGVKNAFALAAGRELQVFVKPDIIDDLQASLLAKEIAQKIQTISNNMKIQVSVIREIKSVEYTI